MRLMVLFASNQNGCGSLSNKKFESYDCWSSSLWTFDLNARNLILADANKNAAGAVILQLNAIKDCWKPVEYASRNVTDTKTLWLKLSPGSDLGMQEVWLLPSGMQIFSWSDDKPLVAILGKKDLSCLTARV